MKCDNCNKSIQSYSINPHTLFDKLFYNTCVECTPTCSQCGQDNGYTKYQSIISDNECHFCCHYNCKSCGINLECKKCGIISCEYCIMNNKEVCFCLRKKLNAIVTKFKSD